MTALNNKAVRNNKVKGIALLIITIVFIIAYLSIMICYHHWSDKSDCRWHEDGYYKADFKDWRIEKEPCDHNVHIYEHKNAFWIFLGATLSVWLISSLTGYLSSKELDSSKPIQ